MVLSSRSPNSATLVGCRDKYVIFIPTGTDTHHSNKAEAAIMHGTIVGQGMAIVDNEITFRYS